MTQLMVPPCEQCGRILEPYALACRNCGALPHRAQLERLAAEAVQLEPTDPAAAAMRWRRCLELLPADSAQYASIYQRLGVLGAGSRGAQASVAAPGVYGHPPYAYGPAVGAAPDRDDSDARRLAAPIPPDDTPVTAILKTGGSMLISIFAYAMVVDGDLMGRLLFATGFVVLILVHELGHVAAMRYYGLSASPPIFIPFLGAMIRLRQAPPNAKAEAIVGIGGPVAGTFGAIACYALYLALPQDDDMRHLVLVLTFLGLLLNLFNLLPVPPLDGGRVTAALDPRIWMLGIAGLGLLIAQNIYAGRFPVVLTLVLLFALPRVRATLSNRAAALDHPYFAITRASRWAIGSLYIGLAVVLSVLLYLTGDPLDLDFFG